MRLRDVDDTDVDAYVRMRCDPAMTADLGGPRNSADMADKVHRDIDDVQAGRAWISMIVEDEEEDGPAVGTVTVYRRDDARAEIGWMVLPEYQGRGLARAAVIATLERAALDGRWGAIHAFPAVTNAASNRLCQSTGFSFVAVEDLPYVGRVFRVNHWRIDPAG